MTKEDLHQLVNELPESEILAAARYLTYLRDVGSDPFLRAVTTAPIDDEPETDEERAATQHGLDALARGAVVSDEDLRRELGL